MRKLLLGLTLVGGCALVGCNQDKPAEPAKTTEPMKTSVNTPAIPKVPAPAASDMTHVLTADTDFYVTNPSGGNAPSAGKLPKGTKVVMMMPMGDCCQVVTEDGKKVYCKMDNMKAIQK